MDEALLTRLFDAALDAVIGMDRDDLIVAWNRQAAAMFGWSREEAVGRSLGELIIPAPLRAAHSRGLQHYLRTGEGPVLNRRIEVEALHRSGEVFPVELTILPLGARHFFAFLRDITEQRESEQRLKQRALEAELLWDAARLASGNGSWAELLQGCLDRICQVTGWPVGHVYLPDNVADPKRLVSSPVWTFLREDLRPIAESRAGLALAPGQGLPGRIWSEGCAQWIPDLAAEDFPRRGIFLQHGLHAAFGFPIFAQGRLQAILEFFTVAKQPPGRHLLNVVQSLGEQLGRVLERRSAEEQRELLLGELTHRVGNTLTIVQSIFARSTAQAESVEELSAAFGARLASLAAAHRHLAYGSWRAAELAVLIGSAVEPYCPSGLAKCAIRGGPLLLPAAAVMPLSMVLHELATNAAKHGAFATTEGTLEVTWSETPSETGRRLLALTWSEQGCPGNSPSGRVGYGTTLIDSTIQRGLGGTIARTYRPEGLLVEITVPLDAEDDAPPERNSRPG